MIELLAALSIGVVGMALCPFSNEPLFKDVETYRKHGKCSFYFAPDCKTKTLENLPTFHGKTDKDPNI